MFDLHTHSLLSDGLLLPSEVAARYAHLGYKVIAITDHADYSNIDFIIDAILKFSRHWPKNAKIKVLPGIELTHLPPEQFKPLAKYARKKGIKVIVAHGQTLAEPVFTGTNKSALEADIDILAHPGKIKEEELILAKKRKIFLEVTARKGHLNTNSYVIKQALKYDAKLIINTDSHSPKDILSPNELIKFISSFGLSQKQIKKIYQDTWDFLKKLLTN